MFLNVVGDGIGQSKFGLVDWHQSAVPVKESADFVQKSFSQKVVVLFPP